MELRLEADGDTLTITHSSAGIEMDWVRSELTVGGM